MTKRHWIGAAVLASAVAIAPALAQTKPPAAPDHDHAAATPDAAPKSGMMGHDHKGMMAEMKAADDRLQELVTKMKTATGEQKVNAIADVVTQLVADHQTMHRHMADMHDMSSSHK